MKNTFLSVRMPEEMKRAALAKARESGDVFSDLIREFTRNYINGGILTFTSAPAVIAAPPAQASEAVTKAPIAGRASDDLMAAIAAKPETEADDEDLAFWEG